MKKNPGNGIQVVEFVWGQGALVRPIALCPTYWPMLCTKEDAQKTCDTIKAFANNQGGPDGVAVDVSVMDFSGQGEDANIIIPDESPVRCFAVAGKFTKGGKEYVVNEYGAIVPDRLPTGGYTPPKPTDKLTYYISEGSGLEFTWS